VHLQQVFLKEHHWLSKVLGIYKVGRSRYSYSFSTRTRRLQRKLRGCQYRVGREKLAVLRDLRDRGFGDESTCLPDWSGKKEHEHCNARS